MLICRLPIFFLNIIKFENVICYSKKKLQGLKNKSAHIYLRLQIYLQCHVNSFTDVSINTPGVNWGK